MRTKYSNLAFRFFKKSKILKQRLHTKLLELKFILITNYSDYVNDTIVSIDKCNNIEVWVLNKTQKHPSPLLILFLLSSPK